MINEHKEIEKLLKNKIKILNENKIKNPKNNNINDEIEKFNKLYRLIFNQYTPFFGKIDINIALRILEDIGISQSELMETYNRLLKEELKKKYTLIDVNLNNKEGER